MTQEPLVSVLLASYNHERWLRASLDSALQQDWPNLEVIVVDDGSSDGSVEILRSYERDGRIKFTAQKNAGLPKALNTALAQAEGRYVAVCSSDDVWLPFKTRLQVDHLEKHPNVIATATNVSHIDEDGAALASPPARKARNLHFEDFLLSRYYFPAPTAMLRRNALVEAGGFETRFRMEDWPTWLKLTHQGGTFSLLQEIAAKYRLHGSNMHRSVMKMIEDRERILELYLEHPRVADAQFELALKAVEELVRVDRSATVNRLIELTRRTPTTLKNARFWLVVSRLTIPEFADDPLMVLVSRLLVATAPFRRRR